MFIKNCLTPKSDLIILKSKTTIGEALDKMNEVKLFSLPVVDGNENFIGIISKQSMFEYLEKHHEIFSFSHFRNQMIDECIDQSAQVFVDVEKDHFEDCLPIIVRHPFVPVVDSENKFIGIVKRSAIERALESTFGLGLPGIRFMLAVDDTEGTLLRISEVVYKFKVNILAAVAFEAGEHFVRRILLKLNPTDKVNEIAEELESHGFRVLEITDETK